MEGKAGDGSSTGTTTVPPQTRKEPPPEDANTIQTRRFIIISFWLIALCLGLPYWIWTTSIQRAELPFQLMDDWANGNTCQLHYPLNIRLASTHLRPEDQAALISQVERQLGDLPDFRLFTFRVRDASTNSDRPILTVQLHEDAKLADATASLETWQAILNVQYKPPTQPGDIDALATFVTAQVHKAFEDEQASLSYLLNSTPFATGNETQLDADTQRQLDARRTRSFKYAPTYHVTFSLFAASASPSAWEIEQALDQYITPLTESMSSISSIDINTQVQLHASISPSVQGPHFDDTTKQWKLQNTDLSGFINAAEWPLSPSIGSGLNINFVLYVPAESQRPLVIAETGGTSWLIPQWGGVQIFNPAQQSQQLTVDDLRPAMRIFAQQLTSLVGLPPAPSSLPLRISSLERERATAVIQSASSTLGALARLVLKLTAIAIPKSVARQVTEAISRLDQACLDIREGRFEQALKNARIADTEADSAFFDPSMLAQNYSPDEHKVAVYVPLLGPMAVPLIMAALNELKKLRKRKQKMS